MDKEKMAHIKGDINRLVATSGYNRREQLRRRRQIHREIIHPFWYYHQHDLSKIKEKLQEEREVYKLYEDHITECEKIENKQQIERMKEEKKHMKNVEQIKNCDDDDDDKMFLLSLYPYIKRLCEKKKAVVKRDMYKLLSVDNNINIDDEDDDDDDDSISLPSLIERVTNR